MADWKTLAKAAIPKAKPRTPSTSTPAFNVADVVLHASRQGVLAHEVNKGAPCLTCGDKCDGGLHLHFWRKKCMNCQCGPEAHDAWEGSAPSIGRLGEWGGHSSMTSCRPVKVGKLSMALIAHLKVEMAAKGYHDAGVTGTERNAVAATASGDGGDAEEVELQEITFAWEPEGIESEQVIEFFNAVPMIHVPIMGTSGEQEFKIRQAKQMPVHDFDVTMCDSLTEVETEEFEEMLKLKTRHHCVGKVMNVLSAAPCHHCKTLMVDGEIGVEIVRTAQGFVFHPKCFVCTECDDLLVGLNSFMEKEKLYCGRHYNDLFKARCKACDESIMEANFVKAEGGSWHTKHFCCHSCDNNLAGKRYVPIETLPHCVPCYDKKDGAKQAVEAAAADDAKEAPDEEIYMTVKLRGQDGNSRIKTMASVKIKAAAPPSDAAPPSRRKSLIADKPSAPAGTPPKRDDSVKIRAPHVPDAEDYEMMWPVGQGPPARKATVVEPAFSASFRKPPARPNLASAIEEEEEDVTEIPGYYGKASAQESESKLKMGEIGDYLLRESVSTAGSYVLCIKLSQIKVVQLKIVVNPNGTYSVPGAKAQFLTFGRLIAADPNAKRPVAARQSNPVSPTRRVPQPFI